MESLKTGFVRMFNIRNSCPCFSCIVRACCKVSFPDPSKWKTIDNLREEDKWLFEEGLEEYTKFTMDSIEDSWKEDCHFINEWHENIQNNFTWEEGEEDWMQKMLV